VQAVSDIVPFRQPRRPRDTTAYIGMVIFLGGWAMMFGGLFFAYAIVRLKAMSWPPPGETHVPVVMPAINTVVMLASSVTLALGLAAVRAARPNALKAYLGLAIALGIAFVTMQWVVWRELFANGLRPDSGIYGSVFYGLTVFHAIHVVVGLIGLLALLPRALRGRFTVQNHIPVRMWAMYWHFVDFVWVVMFISVYVF
jgi:cytochrome c oxidase subunit III